MIEFTHSIQSIDPKNASAYHALVVEHGGYIARLETVEREGPRNYPHIRFEDWVVTVRFKDQMAAASFLAATSTDKERAAQWKLFWSGE